MTPLLPFCRDGVRFAAGGGSGREHYELVDILESLDDPVFMAEVRKLLMAFAGRWLTVFDFETRAPVSPRLLVPRSLCSGLTGA